jgi:hypothetical protein
MTMSTKKTTRKVAPSKKRIAEKRPAAKMSVVLTDGRPFKVGDGIFVRTVTHYLVGRVSAVLDKGILLEDSSWVADTGRLGNALATGNFEEVERLVDWVLVSWGACVDIHPFHHKLPIDTK